MRGMDKVDAGIPIADTVGGISLRCRFRRPLVRRFAVARDQQYRHLDAGTRRSVDQPPDGRAQPAIDEWRKLGREVEDPHFAKIRPRAPASYSGINWILRKATRRVCVWSPMKRGTALVLGKPRSGWAASEPGTKAKAVTGTPFRVTV